MLRQFDTVQLISFFLSPKLLAEEYIHTVGRNCTLNNSMGSYSGSERVKADTRWMNRKIRFLNLKSLNVFLNVFVFFPCFYLNYGEVRRRRNSVLGFLNDSLFHRWSCYFFFTLVRLSFICVLQGKRYFSFLLSASSVIRSQYETR